MSAEIQTGPYIHRLEDRWQRPVPGGRYWVIVVVQRCIGDAAMTPTAGIAILNSNSLQVVLDGHLFGSTMEPSVRAAQHAEVQRLLALDDKAFARFCLAHPRFRGVENAPDLNTLLAPRRTRSRLPELLRRDLSFNDTEKRAFHREARQVLRGLARDGLGLTSAQYDLRVNVAGIAVSGEVILHTEHYYVQVSQSALGKHASVLYRSCNGRRDYTGGMNHFVSAEALLEPASFVERLRKLRPPTAFTTLTPTSVQHAPPAPIVLKGSLK